MRTRGWFAHTCHRFPASAADARAATRRTPSSRFDAESIAPSTTCGPRGASLPRPGVFATAIAGVCALAGLLCVIAPAAWSADGPLDEVPAVRSFLREVESRHGLDRAWLHGLFREARRQQSILDAFSRPAEAKPWHAYRKIFVTPDRIRRGVEFAREHRAVLERVTARFGVPAEIVAAIIGVETFYGRYTGRYRVIDALSTLAFFAPRRGSFFRRELEEFLLMLNEEDRASADLKGSYAGAIGVPQFIPSSYREYAVDFDGDGRRDLVGSVDDAMGSVGSYLHRHGWSEGEPVAFRLAATDPGRADPLAGGLRPERVWGDLEEVGLSVAEAVPKPLPDTPVTLVRLDGARGAEYWVGLPNFYVITRYNHSALYAMAVHQLAVEIRRGGESG